MLARQVERLGRAALIDTLCVATSAQADDDPLVALCAAHSIAVARGSLGDVLDRYYQAALPYEPQHVVRVTGDCPLIDPQVVDLVIRAHLEAGNDYSSNTLTPTYPDGLDVEVFRFAALRRAWSEARLASEREHVTPYIKTRPDIFRLGNVTNDEDLSALRWTVDYPRDLEMVRQVYAALYPRNPGFVMADILELLRVRPDIAGMNTGVERDEGYLKSLRNDFEV